jgi:hypothetical protein
MKLLQLPFWNFFKELWEGEYKYLKFDTGEYWVCILLSVSILAVIVLIGLLIYSGIYRYFDNRSSTKETLSGELIEKRYIGEKSSSGVGSDEGFLFFVKADKVYKMEVDMQQFYGKNVGEKARFEVTTGGMSKDELDVELVS